MDDELSEIGDDIFSDHDIRLKIPEMALYGELIVVPGNLPELLQAMQLNHAIFRDREDSVYQVPEVIQGPEEPTHLT